MAETTICYDHDLQQVRVFTDRASVANQTRKRLKGRCEISEHRSGNRVVSWSITIDMGLCRNPSAIAKVLSTQLEDAEIAS